MEHLFFLKSGDEEPKYLGELIIKKLKDSKYHYPYYPNIGHFVSINDKLYIVRAIHHVLDNFKVIYVVNDCTDEQNH